MIILDTNVLSELIKTHASASVVERLAAFPPDTLFTTAITVAEMFTGIESLPYGKRRDALRTATEKLLLRLTPENILPFDEKSARLFATMRTATKAMGLNIKSEDLQIAAITRAHSASLVTRNTKDFEHCGIPLINPWDMTHE